jgi:hypothetical protein
MNLQQFENMKQELNKNIQFLQEQVNNLQFDDSGYYDPDYLHWQLKHMIKVANPEVNCKVIIMKDTLQLKHRDNISEIKIAIADKISDNKYYDIDSIFDNMQEAIFEICDANCPIYYKEIYDTFYLYRDELTEAYENAGIYSKNDKPDNYEQVSIIIYLEQLLSEFLQNLRSVIKDYINEDLRNKEEILQFIDSYEG